jgi:hypothetical protein
MAIGALRSASGAGLCDVPKITGAVIFNRGCGKERTLDRLMKND